MSQVKKGNNCQYLWECGKCFYLVQLDIHILDSHYCSTSCSTVIFSHFSNVKKRKRNLDMDRYRGKVMWRCREKMVMYKPRREIWNRPFPEGTWEGAATLTSDFWFPEPRDNKFLLFKKTESQRFLKKSNFKPFIGLQCFLQYQWCNIDYGFNKTKHIFLNFC